MISSVYATKQTTYRGNLFHSVNRSIQQTTHVHLFTTHDLIDNKRHVTTASHFLIGGKVQLCFSEPLNN